MLLLPVREYEYCVRVPHGYIASLSDLATVSPHVWVELCVQPSIYSSSGMFWIHPQQGLCFPSTRKWSYSKFWDQLTQRWLNKYAWLAGSAPLCLAAWLWSVSVPGSAWRPVPAWLPGSSRLYLAALCLALGRLGNIGFAPYCLTFQKISIVNYATSALDALETPRKIYIFSANV